MVPIRSDLVVVCAPIVTPPSPHSSPAGRGSSRARRRWRCTAAAFACLILVQPLGAYAQPQELVSSGVSGTVRDTPNVADSTYFWTTIPTCSNAPGDELQPALIYRGGLSV